MIRVEVSMSEELKRFIRTGGDQAREQSQNALDELGVMGESKGKQLLTPSVQTNRLRSSWHWENDRTKIKTYADNQGNFYDGTFEDRPGKQEVYVGTNVEYAGDANKRSRSRGYFGAVHEYISAQFDLIFVKHLRKIN